MVRPSLFRRVLSPGFRFDNRDCTSADNHMIEIEWPTAAKAGHIVKNPEAVPLQFVELIRDHPFAVKTEPDFSAFREIVNEAHQSPRYSRNEKRYRRN